MTSVRIDGIFTLRSPLSHIGETNSATSYLVQEPVLQPDGGRAQVFCYSGNAWRGQLRDLMASYMLDHLGGVRLPLDIFHLLFSGGRIGGTQSVDIDQARRMRAAIPMIALLGGGVGNQILQGKIRVGNAYPVCREAIPLLPAHLRAEAATIPYSLCTFEKEHSRRDDAKIESVRRHLDEPMNTLLGGPPAAKKKGRGDDEGPADQMRIRMELVTSGVRLATWIVAEDVSPEELGCLVSGLHRFADAPHIGGKSAIGYGIVDLDYRITDLRTGEVQDFVSIGEGVSRLAPPAEAAKAAYDAHLRSLYDAMLDSRPAEIKALLGTGG